MLGLPGFFVFLIGAGYLVFGALVRSGRLGRGSTWYRTYRDRNIPAYMRNSPFALVPFGAGAVLVAASLPLLGRADDVAVAMIALAFVSFAGGTVVAFRPPVWMKPRWLREEETENP